MNLIRFDEKNQKTNPLVANDMMIVLDSEDKATIIVDGVPIEVPKVKIKKVSEMSFGGGGMTYFANEVLIQAGVTEVAGKVYNTYANFLAYIATLPAPEQPSQTNQWSVQLPSGVFSELVTFKEGINIFGRNTIVQNLKSEFTFDPTAGTGFSVVLSNLSYINDCIIEKFDFSNGTVTPPLSMPIMPLKNCTINDKNANQNGIGAVVAVDCNVAKLNFGYDPAIPALAFVATGGVIKEAVLPEMSIIKNCPCYSITAGAGMFDSVSFESVDDGTTKNKFGASMGGERINLINCRMKDFLIEQNAFYSAIPDNKRVDIKATFCYIEESEIILGHESGNPANNDKFLAMICHVRHTTTVTSGGGNFGSFGVSNCVGKPTPVNPADIAILSKVTGNEYTDKEGLTGDSNEMIRLTHARSIQCVELVYNYAMFGMGNIQSGFSIPDDAKVLEVRNVVDIAFDGDYDNKIDVIQNDGAFNNTIMQQSDSNLFVKGVYNNLLRYHNTNGGGKVQVNFAQTPYTTPPSKGQGFVQVFFVREALG